MSPHEVPETPNLGLGGHEYSHCISQGKTLSPVNMGADSEQCVRDSWNTLARKLEIIIPFGYDAINMWVSTLNVAHRTLKQVTERSRKF